MKQVHLLSRTVLTVIFILLDMQVRADQLIDGFYYILDANTQMAKLTSVADTTVTELGIPSRVAYNGITYTVTDVGDYAFKKCVSLESLTIPSTVEVLSVNYYCGCFNGCKALKELVIQDGERPLTFKEELNTNVKLEKLYLGRNIAYGPSVYHSVFASCEKTLSSLTVGLKVTDLKRELFKGFENLTVVNLPHVKTIGESCFNGCAKLTTLDLGDALDTLSASAFYGCTNLTNLQFPSTIKYIGDNAFYNCSSITSVSFPLDCALSYIGSKAFMECTALTAFKCPENVAYIGNSAFKIVKNLLL